MYYYPWKEMDFYQLRDSANDIALRYMQSNPNWSVATNELSILLKKATDHLEHYHYERDQLPKSNLYWLDYSHVVSNICLNLGIAKLNLLKNQANWSTADFKKVENLIDSAMHLHHVSNNVEKSRNFMEVAAAVTSEALLFQAIILTQPIHEQFLEAKIPLDRNIEYFFHRIKNGYTEVV